MQLRDIVSIRRGDPPELVFRVDERALGCDQMVALLSQAHDEGVFSWLHARLAERIRHVRHEEGEHAKALRDCRIHRWYGRMRQAVLEFLERPLIGNLSRQCVLTKGAAILARDPEVLRDMGDIDIAVFDIDSLAALVDGFVSHGWYPPDRPRPLAGVHDGVTHVVLDLVHGQWPPVELTCGCTRLCPESYPTILSYDYLAAATEVTVGSGRWLVPATEDMIVLMAVNACMNARVRLVDCLDYAILMRRETKPLDWAYLLDRCRRFGVLPYLFEIDFVYAGMSASPRQDFQARLTWLEKKGLALARHKPRSRLRGTLLLQLLAIARAERYQGVSHVVARVLWYLISMLAGRFSRAWRNRLARVISELLPQALGLMREYECILVPASSDAWQFTSSRGSQVYGPAISSQHQRLAHRHRRPFRSILRIGPLMLLTNAGHHQRSTND